MNSDSQNNINTKTELRSIFLEEFFECFQDILITSQYEFLSKYLHRVNAILTAYNQKLIPFLKAHLDLFESTFHFIVDNYYIPIKEMCKKEMVNKEKEYLKNFSPHCLKTPSALHSCLNKFIIVKDLNSHLEKYVICSNCNYVYTIDYIPMYCSECDCDYYSCYIDKVNLIDQPATWISNF